MYIVIIHSKSVSRKLSHVKIIRRSRKETPTS